MNSAPHLLNEDREEFRRILDEALSNEALRGGNEALRGVERRQDGATAAGPQLTTEQLRTMAISAMSAIAACATAEYERYVELRTELRTPAAAARPRSGGRAGDDSAGEDGAPAADGSAPTTAMGGFTETSGAGLLAMVTVLAPLLAGISAILFLVIGYGLHTISPGQAAGESMINVGWIFAALTAASFLIAMGGLLITALRNGATSLRAASAGELAQEVERAHKVWREALLERGLLPFLREAQSATTGTPTTTTTTSPAAGPHAPLPAPKSTTQMPTLGYTRPDFTGPDHQESDRQRD